MCRSRVCSETFQRDCPLQLHRSGWLRHRHERLLSELPSEVLTAMRKHKLCNPGTLRSYPRALSSGVLAVTASSWSTAPDNTTLIPTSTPMVGTFKASEPEDVEGLTCVAGRSGEGKRTHAMEGHDKHQVRWEIAKVVMDSRVLLETTQSVP